MFNFLSKYNKKSYLVCCDGPSVLGYPVAYRQVSISQP